MSSSKSNPKLDPNRSNIIKPTLNFRFERRTPMEYGIHRKKNYLQQGWIDVYTGETIWIDVPTVDKEEVSIVIKDYGSRDNKKN